MKNRQSTLVSPVNIHVERKSPDETRAAILAVAWDLFRQLGARTTIADVASRLGMSSANVYRFFASKQALCEAVCANQLGGMIDAAQAIAAGPGTPTERIRAILLAMFVAMRDQMTNQQRVHEIVDTAIAERWPPIAEYESAIIGVLAGLVAEGQARGEFGPGDPTELAFLTMCACSGIHHPHLIALYADKGDAPPETIANFALRALANTSPSPPSGG